MPRASSRICARARAYVFTPRCLLIDARVIFVTRRYARAMRAAACVLCVHTTIEIDISRLMMFRARRAPHTHYARALLRRAARAHAVLCYVLFLLRSDFCFRRAARRRAPRRFARRHVRRRRYHAARIYVMLFKRQRARGAATISMRVTRAAPICQNDMSVRARHGAARRRRRRASAQSMRKHLINEDMRRYYARRWRAA